PSVCTTTTRRPTRSGRVVPSTRPARTARKKFVFDSIVVVAAPDGRFRKAQIAPSVSPSAMRAAPCSTSPVVQRSGAHSSRPRTSAGVAAVTSMPRARANGMDCATACGSTGMTRRYHERVAGRYAGWTQRGGAVDNARAADTVARDDVDAVAADVVDDTGEGAELEVALSA